MNSNNSDKMGFNATWSMAVGGMVGGGIFSVLGVVVMLAGKWAWLSFTFAGLIALATAYSYSQLADKFGEGGGAFTFLREMNRKDFAGSLSWVLIFGYILTISVYAFTFGHYVAHVFNFGAWMPRACAVAVVFVLIAVNLKGVGESAILEIVTVWGKLLILIGLAAIGLWKWQPEQLTAGIEPQGILGAVIGAASVFMAYEGFQLLAYDYEDIRDPKKTLPRAVISAVVAVILVYILVATGATMLVGAQTIVERKEIAIAVAGRKALGTWGLGLATVAAAFSTGSAINATLFATARLMHEVAKDHELPPVLCHRNENGVPDRPVIIIGGIGALLAVLGSLEMLVEAASLTFLFTFTAVNVMAFLQCRNRRWVFGFGGVGAAIAGVVLTGRLIIEAPLALALLTTLGLIATFGRPRINRFTERLHEKKGFEASK
jgi:amino acid transporter